MKMDFSGLKKLGDKVKEAAENANLDEKLSKAKKGLGEAMDKSKEVYAEFAKNQAENKALADAAKAPVEGAIIRYQVIYKGGFPMKPQKKTDSLSIGFNIMEDRFIFKPEIYAKRDWFGEENFEVLFEQVTKFEVVKRQVSMSEAMLSSNGDTKSLEQPNTIEITYNDENGEHMLRVEMLTGTSVYGQAEKCREMLDLLREKQILNKLNKANNPAPAAEVDVLAQIEKLSALYEKGIIKESEYEAKKAALLEKL